MPTCPACHAEADLSSIAQGRCGKCGAMLRSVPKRKIQDIRDTLAQGLSKPTDGPTDGPTDKTKGPLQEELETLDP